VPSGFDIIESLATILRSEGRKPSTLERDSLCPWNNPYLKAPVPKAPYPKAPVPMAPAPSAPHAAQNSVANRG